MVVLVTLEAVAILLLGLLVAGLLRSHAEILRSLHDLGAGHDPGAEPAPQPANVQLRDPSSDGAFDLVGTSPNGDAVSVGVLGEGRSTLLAFLTSGCLTCKGFWDTFARSGEADVPGGARLVIVTKGREAESESKVRQLAPSQVAVVMSSQAWTDYEVPVAPYFLYVDGPSRTVVGEGSGSTWDQVSSLLSEALDDADLGGGGNGGAERERRRRRARVLEAEGEARADHDLLAAGIHPGHPSLYPVPESEPETEEP